MGKTKFISPVTADSEGALGEFLNRFHFNRFAQPDVEYRDSKTDKLVVYHAKQVVKTNEQLYEHLHTVSKSPNNRGSAVAGKGAMQPRITQDGKLSSRRAVPKSVLEAAGNPKADQLGFFDYRNRNNRSRLECRLTNWTKDDPEVYFAALPFIIAADKAYQQLLPQEYATQKAELMKVQKELIIAETAFSTVTVNKNFRTACHQDQGDLRCGTGVMATFGEFKGCEFVIPQYGLAVDYRPGDVLFADVHLAHGNAPVVSGERVTTILFCRERMSECEDR